MPRLVRADEKEVVYLPEELEPGTGRTARQIRDMAKNAPKPVELQPEDVKYARQIAKDQADYPKILYIAAQWKRVESEEFGDEIVFLDGDVKTPQYHSYNQINRGKTVPVFDRHPFRTILVNSLADEKAALKKGFVHSPAELQPYAWEISGNVYSGLAAETEKG